MMYGEEVVERILFTENDIKEVCAKLGKQIYEDYKERNPILICTLKGSFMFFAELVKNIGADFSVEYIKASSYIGAHTSGEVKLSGFFTNFEVKDRDILIVEDIVDTGLTIQKLTKFLMEKGANSVEVVTMLNKKVRRIVDVTPKYVGFEIPDLFVIGYGLDYNEKYRNIPFIGIMNPKYIEK